MQEQTPAVSRRLPRTGFVEVSDPEVFREYCEGLNPSDLEHVIVLFQQRLQIAQEVRDSGSAELGHS